MRIKLFLKRPLKRLLAVVFIITALLLCSDKLISFIGKMIYPMNYEGYVDKYCAEYNVDKALCFALIKCESNFNENAVSSVGASGLMQLTDETFLWIGEKIYGKALDPEQVFDPEINIRCGIWYLSYLFEKFEDEGVVIAAYNAGPGKVSGWLENPKYSDDGKTLSSIAYKETATHVEKVQRAEGIYKKLYNI